MNQSDNPNERRKEVVLADGKTYIEVSTLRHYWLFDRYEKIEPDQSAAANSDSVSQVHSSGSRRR
jgi:hypothetical protein